MGIVIKAEDFPVYQLLVEMKVSGVEDAVADFNAAAAGGDAEKYQFALGMQSVAASVPAGAVPGLTREMNEKTLRSCLAVFQAVAAGRSDNAADARHMVRYFERNRLGL